MKQYKPAMKQSTKQVAIQQKYKSACNMQLMNYQSNVAGFSK